jgi:hypothetical protein
LKYNVNEVAVKVDSLLHVERNTPAGELLVERLEHLSLPYLARIWRRRAELLGGCPVLDMKGERIIMSRLREDGRCRPFAVGVRADLQLT